MMSLLSRVQAVWACGRRGGLAMLLLGAGGVPALWAQAGAQGATPAVTAFVDVAVIPMDREQLLTHQTVVVQGDRIAALGPVGTVAVPAGARRIDGRGAYLLPGLADMHVHVGMGNRKPGTPLDSIALLRYLAQGVTTVRDMHSGRGPDSYALRLKRAVASGALVGPRIYAAGDLGVRSRSGPTQYDWRSHLVFDSAAIRTVADSTAQLKHDGYDFVKEYGEHSPIYDSVVAGARRVGLPIVGHVPDDDGQVYLDEVLRDRWASIEHLTGYIQTMTGGFGSIPFGKASPQLRAALDTVVWMQPGHQWDTTQMRALAEATRRAGVWNCPTLWGAYDFMSRRIPALAAGGAEIWTPRKVRWAARVAELLVLLTRALHEAGAGLILGTDGEPIADELKVLVEQAGLSPYEALVTGTRNIAEFLGTRDSTGTVAVGKRADLVLLADNPLQVIGTTATPVGTMVSGRWFTRAELDARLQAAKLKQP